LIIAGVVPVSNAWGGTQSDLTPGLRIASLVAIVVLAGFAYIIRRRAGLTASDGSVLWVKILSWVVTAYMLFNLLGNLTAPGFLEKFIMGPITLLLSIASFLVSISKG
jgi:hypothetical protein